MNPSLHHAYLHGFASSARSLKGLALQARYAERGLSLQLPELAQPDFSRQTIGGALEALDRMHEAAIVDGDPPPRWRLIGSSLGGYLAARWAELHPERVDRLLLLCPAFDIDQRWSQWLGETAIQRWRQSGQHHFPGPTGSEEPLHWAFVEELRRHPARPVVPCPTHILHGRLDETVPLQSSRGYAEEHPTVQLIELEDDHRLTDSLDRIAAEAFAFLLPNLEPTTFFWDFFGPPARGTAEHFRVHLDEFLQREGLEGCRTGIREERPGQVSAWCQSPPAHEAILLRALKPRRKV